MEAKEMRIGNYFKPTDGSKKEFELVTGADLYAWSERGAIYGKPILLSDEWISSLGFENSGDFFILNDIRIYKFHPKFESDTYIFDFGMQNSYLELDYVHELQNLYFALTGEELFF